MYKALAVVRTIFLVFIVGYTLLTAPTAIWGSATVAVSIDSLRRLDRAAWLAIGWIAFETVLAWIVIRLRRPGRRQAATPSTPEPPAATRSP